MTAHRMLIGSVVLAALALTACGMPDDTHPVNLCRNDSDCAEGEVCFLNGCGAPDTDVRVEITPNVSMGRYAQDFVVPQFGPAQDFSLYGPALITGAVLRESATEPIRTSPAQVEFTIRGEGTSELIPGLVRRFEATVNATGSYSVATGMGRFNVTVAPKELPPIQFNAVSVGGGVNVPIDVVVPALERLVRLDGRLVKQGTTLLDAPYDLQALDPDTLQPLSARAQVSMAVGDFQLHLGPRAVMSQELILRATPRDPQLLQPTKDFLVRPEELNNPLELGDPGAAFDVIGRLFHDDGRPLAGARVHLMGTVRGNGTFETARVLTDAEGRFTITTFAAKEKTSLIFHAQPPAMSDAGILRQEIAVGAPGDLGHFTCPDRVRVVGTLLRPDGAPAVGVAVIATPIGARDMLPLPAESVEAKTDSSGTYRLQLDAGIWRLDFLPGEQLPRVSRILTVAPQIEQPEQWVDAFVLSRGRVVTGSVKEEEIVSISPSKAAANAALRLYRVVELNGTTTSVLLSQTVTDENGNYSLIIPTR